MNPTLFALCQKPVIGPALWITTLCSFSPLLSETPVSLETASSVLSAQFEAPVSKAYFMSMTYRFRSKEERLHDKLIGAAYDVQCYGKNAKTMEDFPESRRADLGKPLHLRITIKRMPEGAVVLDRRFASICRAGHDGAAEKSQVVGLVELVQGNYSVTVENVDSRGDLAALAPRFSITSGGK